MSQFHNHTDNLAEIINYLPAYEDAVIPAELFSILSDPTRIRILWLLCHTTECVLDIGLAINMSSPAVSHHLKILKSHNIITSKKVGKEMQYTLADNKYAKLIHNMLDDMFNISCPTQNKN
jgi:DNA-binding transcriptional ArsR family regulator